MTNTTDWAWCYENPKDAAALIDRLESENKAMRDALQAVSFTGAREDQLEAFKLVHAALFKAETAAAPEFRVNDAL
jgi:hypothetical protein